MTTWCMASRAPGARPRAGQAHHEGGWLGNGKSPPGPPPVPSRGPSTAAGPATGRHSPTLPGPGGPVGMGMGEFSDSQLPSLVRPDLHLIWLTMACLCYWLLSNLVQPLVQPKPSVLSHGPTGPTYSPTSLVRERIRQRYTTPRRSLPLPPPLGQLTAPAPAEYRATGNATRALRDAIARVRLTSGVVLP